MKTHSQVLYKTSTAKYGEYNWRQALQFKLHFHRSILWRDIIIIITEMGGEYSKYVGEERCIQVFGGET
jgi:hypothetical protein